MPKQIVSDIFETLGGSAKSAGQQVATELGLKSAPKTANDQPNQPVQNEEQEKKIKDAYKQRTAANYKKILDDINQIQKKREQAIPKQVSGKPGFDEGKVVKQLETGKPPEKKKLPPINVQRERTKAERFRGASG